jgi:hypothetical protein
VHEPGNRAGQIAGHNRQCLAVGAVIGLVRSGVNAVATAGDLVRYARRCPEIMSTTGPGDEAVAYDAFAGGVVDDESLCRGFPARVRALAARTQNIRFWRVPD